MLSIVIGIFLFVGIGVYIIIDDLISMAKNFKHGYFIVMFYIVMAIVILCLMYKA